MKQAAKKMGFALQITKLTTIGHKKQHSFVTLIGFTKILKGQTTEFNKQRKQEE
jgi:hypothetical protein